MNTEAIETATPLAQIKVDNTECLNEGTIISAGNKYYEIIFIMGENDLLVTEITIH